MAEERAQLIASTEAVLIPDRHMFGIFDTAEPFDQSAPMPGEAGGLLGAGKTSLLIGSLQQSIAVSLRLESWTSRPPTLPPDLWGDQGEAVINLPTGKLWISRITMGGLDLPGFSVPPGAYAVRVAGHGRREMRDAENELLWAEEPEPGAELAGQEKYLVQFWPMAN